MVEKGKTAAARRRRACTRFWRPIATPYASTGRGVHVFWGDERCVPPADPMSNYRMVRQTLIDQVVAPHDGSVCWLLDAVAAAKLTEAGGQ